MSTGPAKRTRPVAPSAPPAPIGDGGGIEPPVPVASRGCCGKSGGGGNGGSGRGCCNRCFEKCVVCTATLTRVCLIIPNLVFLLFGGTLIGLGVWMRADRESSFYFEVLRALPASPLITFDKVPVVIIAVGSCVAILSFLGCCGACSESVCFLSLYSVLLFLILSTEIVISILVAVFQNKLLLSLERSMQHQITFEYNKTARLINETRTRTNHITTAWDILQIKLNCCGATSYRDYKFSTWFNHTRDREGRFVPPSCCFLLNDDPRDPWIKDEDACQIDAILFKEDEGPITSKSLKSQGCQRSVIRWLRARILIIIAVVSSGAVVQVLHFIFACVLLASVRRSHSDLQWYQDDCG